VDNVEVAGDMRNVQKRLWARWFICPESCYAMWWLCHEKLLCN